MMARSPNNYYPLVLIIILILTLTGCELRRDSNQTSDLEVGGEVPTPTLASLGSDDSDLVAEATPIPTVINVQPTATESLLQAGEAAENPNEPVVPTSQPVLAPTAVVSNQAEEVSITTESATPESVAPDTFVPPSENLDTEEPIIVDAPAEELPDGGPIAANPPAAESGVDDGTAIYDNATTHVVQPGDTLFSLSLRYGTTVEAFMRANGLTSDLIYQGQTLNIPTAGDLYAPPGYAPTLPGGDGSYHVVAAGETLFSIAQRYGTSVDAIARANGIAYPYIIYAGQYLNIPVYGADPGLPPPSPPGSGYYPPQDYPPQDPMYPTPNGAGTHTVAPGETLYSIAYRYGTTAQAIAEANGISNPNQIYVGQVLYLP
jgi:LysM repeat protein